jgi:hypothetical protein
LKSPKRKIVRHIYIFDPNALDNCSSSLCCTNLVRPTRKAITQIRHFSPNFFLLFNPIAIVKHGKCWVGLQKLTFYERKKLTCRIIGRQFSLLRETPALPGEVWLVQGKGDRVRLLQRDQLPPGHALLPAPAVRDAHVCLS